MTAGVPSATSAYPVPYFHRTPYWVMHSHKMTVGTNFHNRKDGSSGTGGRYSFSS